MKNKISYAVSILLASGCINSFAEPPLNLSCAKNAVKAYYTAPKGKISEYEKDVDVIAKRAEKFLHKRVAENNKLAKPQKLAIVLDIDDTSLSNYLGNDKDDFSARPELIDARYRKENSTVIPPMLRLYNEAIKAGVTVFFVSFRPDNFRTHTINNLKKAGYHDWKNIYLPNSTEINLPSRIYKTAVRKMITKDLQYTIILNLGDQESDLVGGFAERTERIPNPIYTTSPCPSQRCV